MFESETKFVLNNSAVHLIIQWLRSRCLPDPDFPAGIVSSIYYDTREWQFLREKVNSDYHKTKIRIRWYVDINTDEPSLDSFLEAKYKIGGRREKHRVKTDISGEWLSGVRLDNVKLLDIPRRLWKHGIIVRGPLLPVFKISYKRLRFIEPVTRTRVCIDYDICAPAVNRQMVPFTNPFRLNKAVFELKGSLTRLPDTLHQLTALGCRKESFSKYALCYNKIMRIVL